MKILEAHGLLCHLYKVVGPQSGRRTVCVRESLAGRMWVSVLQEDGEGTAPRQEGQDVG